MISPRPAGDAGLLVETDAWPAVLAAAITEARLPGVIDVVPGARTVLVRFRPGSWRHSALAAAIAGLDLPAHNPADEETIWIPVVYDGQDLAEVARLTGLSADEVVAVHSAGEYEVGWLGFAPGFGYLTGLDPRLDVPRLATPRVAVPAGSVAIAGGLAAVYPAASPGGWRLLGHTTARMWDTSRDPPALLMPGRRVRFEPVPSGSTPPAAAVPGGPAAAVAPGQPSLEIVRTGPLATVQDLGRPGYGAVGVPPSGAADVASLTVANRLAGNPDSAAAVELTLGRAVVRCPAPVRLAIAGAPAVIRMQAAGGEAAEVPFGTAFDVPAGATVSIGAPAVGLRTYLAVGGGVTTPPVLGSRSADLLAGLGAPLRAGDVLPVGAAAPAGVAAAGAAPAGHGFAQGQPADGQPAQGQPAQGQPADGQPADASRVRLPERGAPAVLRVLPGPRDDWFAHDAIAMLCDFDYTVGPASNRTGLRLAGPALVRRAQGELASEGMVTGALQVPPDGQPILLLADYPTTGGYPVIAVVISADISLAAQLRPGEAIRFRTVR